jgi:hypothetical protein
VISTKSGAKPAELTPTESNIDLPGQTQKREVNP